MPPSTMRTGAADRRGDGAEAASGDDLRDQSAKGVSDHGRLLLQLADHFRVMVGNLSDGLTGEYLRVLVGLVHRLGVIGPSRRERRVAGLLENRGPAIPTVW